MTHDYDVQYRFLVWSLSHVIDALGWRQHAVLRQHKLKLKPIHLSLLLRAGRHGKVSFDDIRRDTGMPIHSISRAAQCLVDRGLGTVLPIKSDGRRRRFHINKKGRALLEAVETRTAGAIQRDIGAESFDSSARYYEFTVHLWNLTRFLPERGCSNDEYFFPTDISADEWRLPDEDDFRVLVEPLWARRRGAVQQLDSVPQ